MFRQVIYVAFGSMIGGVCRFLLQQFVQRRFLSSFPYGTLCVNLLGCFVIGIVYALANRGGMADNTRIFLAAGICGGFTTYSSFMYENYAMLHHGQAANGFLYIGISLFAGYFATFLGVLSVKFF
jgi:fluoride exporter